MSIINQTLRALDARQPDSTTSPPVLQRPTAVAKQRSRQGLWVAAAVLLLAGAGVWLVSRPPEGLPRPQTVITQRAVMPQAATPAPSKVPASTSAVPPRMRPTAKAQVAPVVAEIRPRSPEVNAGQNQSASARPAKPSAVPPTTTMSAPAEKPPAIRKEDTQPTVEEQAEDRYRKALTLIQKDRGNLARPLLEEALELSPSHVAARETLAALLSDAGLNREAEAVLRAGRALNPDHAWFALSLARLQAARGDTEDAAATLQSGMAGRGVNADYHATLAALLVRLKQYPDAARQYEQALRLQPGQGTWWMGLGLSMEGQGKSDEARSAYRRALTAGNLPDKFEEFVRAKLVD